MTASLHEQLLTQARRLANLGGRGRPKQGDLRRAVSTPYYALFHYLVHEATRALLGTRNDRRPYRDVLGRVFEHGVMRQACRSFAGGELRQSVRNALPRTFSVPIALRRTAHVFQEAMEKRHVADYDRSATFRRSDVLSLIQSIQQAMEGLNGIKTQVEVKFFLCCLLTWDRLDRRR